MATDITRQTQAVNIINSKINLINTIVSDKAKVSVYASALKSMASDWNLKDCSVDSILDVGLSIIQAGLNPNKLFGQAYVVPFNLKNGGKTAQLQIGYKGWISLGYRNGWKFKATIVYSCDEFKFEFGGFEDKIIFNPNYEARNDDDGGWVHKNLIGVLVYAKDKTGDVWTEFVSSKKLEKLRLKSQNQNSKTALSGVWLDWAEEMYKAKAIKYVVTKLPINDSLMEVALKEDENFKKEPIKEDKKLDLNAIVNDTKEAIEDKQTIDITPVEQKDGLDMYFEEDRQ
ncbi:recombinase RecT [Campylobacter fetus]|uniref:recombinase RecT n=1 Tax=Campylobacter fetus TaxID=196 RepID=UPI000818C15E|nr:recombinase RecT [Campylobacter fetus]